MTWNKLWEQEQELILLLEEINEKRFAAEGQKKTMEENLFANGESKRNIFVDAARLTQQNAFNNPTIIQPAQPTQPVQNNFSFDDDDFMGNLSQFEAAMKENGLTIPDDLLLIGSQRSQKKSEEKPQQIMQESLRPLIVKAAELSASIVELHKELSEGDQYLCDTLTVKQADIQSGGNGYRLIDGEETELPEQPLSKTCPKRNGSWQLGAWLFECVFCPINFQQSEERFNKWQTFLAKNKEKNRGTTND